MSFYRLNSSQPWPFQGKSLSLTIGNFDGVHLGHRQLLKRSLEWSRKQPDGISILITFNPHPQRVLFPQVAHERLFDLQDQAEQVRLAGLDAVFVQEFNLQFAQLSAEEFLENFLFQNFQPRHIVVGHDFRFGKNRSGDFSLLQKRAAEKNILVEQVEPYVLNGEIVSTSQVRKALEAGDMESAEAHLGRRYVYHGQVVKGDGRATQIGFPTANIQTTTSFAPRMGVYATKMHVKGHTYNCITNIGRSPTFHASDFPIRVEAHVFDFQIDIYGQVVKLELFHFVRDEIRFGSVAELKNQIQKDCIQVQNYFQEHK